jgi:ubiquitin
LGVQTPKKPKNPIKTYEDKVLKNEASEKDSALPSEIQMV